MPVLPSRLLVAPWLLVAWLTLSSAATPLGAQTPAKPEPPLPSAAPVRAPLEWDSVAIHLSKEGETNASANDQPNGMVFHDVSVLGLLGQAYGFSIAEMREEDVTGLPDWAKKQHYEIVAHVAPEDAAAYKKMTDDVPMTEMIKSYARHEATPDMVMLRNLLEDRFHLRVHYGQKERPVYALTVDKGGPKLKQAVDPNHGTLQFNAGVFKAEGVPTLFLASILSLPLQRQVVDRTGLTGNYDFALHFLPEGETAKPDNNDPDLFTALREQLGLKLESTRAPVLVLVVDHIDPPTPN